MYFHELYLTSYRHKEFIRPSALSFLKQYLQIDSFLEVYIPHILYLISWMENFA